jgi:hypothetical protein
MKSHYYAGALGMVLTAFAGGAQAAETTSVFRQGNSTATVTQDDGGSSATTRRVIRRGPNSQTIVQSQGGNSLSIQQSVEEESPEDLDELEGEDW